jgi:hypothetical protein
MGSLTAHLRRPNDHPECPLCSGERFAGRLAPGVVVGRRAQALLAAGVLALSSATPATVLAAEPDQEQEGTTPPEQVVAAEPPSDSAADPGGQATDLPFDAAPAPAAQIVPDPADGAGPVEQESVANVEAPTPDAAPAPPAAAPTVPEPAPSAVTPEPVAATPAQPETGATTQPPAQEHEAAKKTRRPRVRASVPEKVRPAPVPRPQAVVQAQPVPRPHAVVQAQPAGVSSAVLGQRRAVQTESMASSSGTASRGRAAQRGDHFHVVQRDESLWSIAVDLIGDGASAARIAREVDRLWELNSTPIGTGNPDLLITGTRLDLR